MPKIQIASDLHLEFYESETENQIDLFEKLVQPNTDADTLILAGDIGYPESKLTEEFFTWACGIWMEVIWVLGNHEYYTKGPNKLSMEEKETIAENYMLKRKNLYVLNNSSHGFEYMRGLGFLGTTLWTDLDPYNDHLVRHGLNDFKNIRMNPTTPFNTKEWRRRHAEARAFLQEGLDMAKEMNKRVVVVSHYLPSYKMISEQYSTSPLNCGFAANMDDLLEHPSVAVWICGHSHGKRKIEVSNGSWKKTPCILNARGYPGEESETIYRNDYVVNV